MPRSTPSKMLRRSKALGGSWRMWKMRLVFWAGAGAIGVVSVGFAWLADRAQALFHALTHAGSWNFLIPLLLTPAGFALCALLAARVFPASQGSGIPQAIAARHVDSPAGRSRLLSMRIAVGKILLTVIGLFCGGSIGREGPTVQVGASIMLFCARLGGMARADGLILAGSAAGIAAAFNTPLAGIVFAIEEMSKTYHSRVNSLVLIAVIVSGLAALGMVGSYTYFGTANPVLSGMKDWLLVGVCGIGGGAFGALFSAGALSLARRIRRWTQVSAKPLLRAVVLAALCGLGVALIGISTHGATYGTGYEQARGAVEGQALPLFYFVEKLAASFLTMISGIPGGIFAPSLSVGAGLGSTAASLTGSSIALGAILGMAGYFAGVVQAPMTAFVIIMEMTASHDSAIAIMATAMLGYATSRLLAREPLYHGLSRPFLAEAIRAGRAADREQG
ncbi:chloride channel protein [Allorhizobium taibaishanense]|uniref:Chloride channel protein n=1 Tax=Allorhizobium taibaishanense TaxID=887144 RepID=A0A1Q9AAM0_9HYPH|nr:chloride channel protein [Allorhizobium taibaishanense]MBB4007127.1 H+/Cl- antiporter ClcA [Allorhizobium taibaishanense]OLP51914.1 chloride channel protein [Allorhizobium taibaishanense]